jgi:hypothetical protein
LCEETRQVARLYFRALNSVILKDGKYDLNMAIKERREMSDDIHRLYTQKIEDAFRKLDVDSQRIINNDFFFNNYKFWWIELYSTSTYYRLKRTAICRFLDRID